MLQVFFTNHTTADIKNVVIDYVAWDDNSLPVKIKGAIDFSDGSYIAHVNFNDINLSAGTSYGENAGYEIGEKCNISFFKAIVETFETFDGDIWNNPYTDAWEKMYAGVKYRDDLTTEIEVKDVDDFERIDINSEDIRDEKESIGEVSEDDVERTRTEDIGLSNDDVDYQMLEKNIREQDFRVKSTRYIVQDEEYKSLYPDMLQAILKNDTDLDIKSAVVAFVAWDQNKLPVKIKAAIDFSDGAYIQEVNFGDINMIPGSSYGRKSGFEIDEKCNIDQFKAIVVSYEAFDGTIWDNPLYDEWCEVYEGVKLQ